MTAIAAPDLHPEIREDYSLELVAMTALHVGAPTDDRVSDLPLATDGQGRLLVPATSLAGVLRAMARQHCRDAVDAIFGYPGDDDDGHASRLVVADAVITADHVELRTGVGIDRQRGAAADRLLYDRLVLPAGTALTVDLRYEGPRTEQLRKLVSIVRAIGLRLGAATGRGLGTLECRAATVRRTELASRSAVLDLLAGTAQFDDVAAASGLVPTALRFELAWRTRRPVVVGGPSASERADLVPVLTRSGDGTGLTPLLPGSSVKGVLRSAAERVLRTVVLDLPAPGSDAVRALDQVGAAVPAHGELFGTRDRRGALSVADTVAEAPPVPADRWRDYLLGEESSTGWMAGERTHVAIDRWTGGAADGRLFTVQETAGVRWPPLVLEVDPARIAEGRLRAAVVLLGLAVAQLLDGQLGLGHGTTRGLGEITIERIGVSGTEQFGLPAYRAGDDWWAWLRDVAGNADLLDLLEKGKPNE